ncbi:hypothetical protein [Streptomyces sp. MUM 178J]|uniref:hypothetical protein n=1 Tax=Streptomyces sp. MUM 178J TaxID=2791991 RepID=UPI001F04ED2A|nr:hypothetical protein [Streptomyces sp. MUM 178J]WRQ82976.1 hypothetical protein I3F59_028510 [Streptomyces sp. MUM 178J]
MAITDDLRKTFTDPKPLYFAAGTADLAYQQALKLPGLVEQIRTEAPARIEAVRKTDPKAVQEKVTAQAKETQATVQAKVAEVLENMDTDFRKFGETAQDLALRGVGFAAEYAVKARDTYEKVAEHGEQAVRTWRGGVAEEINEIAVAVEPQGDKQADGAADAVGEVGEAGEEKKVAPARKAPARKAAAKKTAPPAK